MTKKTKAPQDLTLRNLRALRRDMSGLAALVGVLASRIAELENHYKWLVRPRPADAPTIEVTFASGEGGDDIGEDKPA